MTRERERENPLPPDAWVELVGQFDEGDDARGRYLAARRRPYDAVEHEITPVRPAFPSSPGEAFTEYLDRRPPRQPALLDPGPRRGDLGLTLPEAWARLQAEYPPLAACVTRCCVGRRPQPLRAAAAALGVSHRTVRERKLAGVAQLVVWSGLSQRQVEGWLRESATARAAATPTGIQN